MAGTVWGSRVPGLATWGLQAGAASVCWEGSSCCSTGEPGGTVKGLASAVLPTADGAGAKGSPAPGRSAVETGCVLALASR